MKSFPKRLLLFFAGIVGFAACASALTAVVEYKPWGVPDSRREDYDTKIAQLNQRDFLLAQFAERARPIAVTDGKIRDCGLLAPGSNQLQQIEIRNEGQEPLELTIGTNHSCEASLADRLVQPGASTSVEISWKTGDSPGAFKHSLSIQTNDPLNENLQFTIRGVTGSRLVVPDTASFKVADPAHRTSSSFVVYSQTWTKFQIDAITSDLDLFDWHAEPIELSDRELEGCNARSAWRVRLWTTPMEFGHYSADVRLSIVAPTGETSQFNVEVAGRVRPPIVFQSPEIHMSDGLDLGTRFSGSEHTVHLLVRVRGDLSRDIKVLDVQPSELRATLEPQSAQGIYRLTLTIPAECPMVVFNTAEKHGYVEVGDPNDEQFNSWFPIHGAVVPKQR